MPTSNEPLERNSIEVLNYERFRYPCPLVQKRMHVVYEKLKFGSSDLAISMRYDCCRKSVKLYLSMYKERGVEGLKRFNYGTNKSELDLHKETILASFEASPPIHAAEAKARIFEMTAIDRSPTQIQAFMKRHGLRYRKLGTIPGKADAQKQAQWLEKEFEPELEKAQKGESVLFFMDAAHFILSAFLCSVWSKTRLFLPSGAGRNRINVLGAVNAITKEVITIHNTTYINAKTIVEFFHILRNQIPLEKSISIICDNARYQHCNWVIEQAKLLNINMVFLPPYSPNLNIIERLWKLTKKEVLYAKYYKTPLLFHNAISDFMNNINTKHIQKLSSLLTLNFQVFNNVKIYPV